MDQDIFVMAWEKLFAREGIIVIIQPNCLKNVQLEAIIRNSEIQRVHVQAVPRDIIVQQDSRFIQTSAQLGITVH